MLKKRLVMAVLVVVAFAAGMAVNHLRFANADTAHDGYSNQVIEILEGGSPTGVYTTPDLTSPTIDQVDVLLWGDRVMYDGVTTQNDSQGNRWIFVALAEGKTGWMIANFADANSKVKISSAVYTTPGMAVGKTVTVTTLGDQANFRSTASVLPGKDNIIRLVNAGETLTVVGGPYQAQYFIWWEYEDANGQSGWIVDIEGWFQVN
ncbi:MAG: hypothetical protein H6673_03330 [Anaerolineales bacterium]|nr:hypothetical protein [Anaerolineales bacterium]